MDGYLGLSRVVYGCLGLPNEGSEIESVLQLLVQATSDRGNATIG